MGRQVVLWLIILGGVVSISGCLNGSNSYFAVNTYMEKVKPAVVEYNKSKGAQNNNITIKGKAVLINESSFIKGNLGNYSTIEFLNYSYVISHGGVSLNDTHCYVKLPENESATLFIVINFYNELYASPSYYLKGNPSITTRIDYYRPIVDLVVVYWPENKIVGWHRVYGEVPEIREDASGPRTGEENTIPWITSLPGFTELYYYNQ